MMRLRSVRARLLAGSIVWGIGLILLAHLSSVLLFIGSYPFRGLLHLLGLFSTALLLMFGGFLLAASGMSALARLRERLAAVHNGHERTVGGDYPTEVQPLVDDLNALLEHRDTRVKEALAKAGDLAHGLKTPLAVLAHEADRAKAAGHTELAAALQQQIDRMRRQVDYHLAHARAAASGATPGARASVRESAEALARTLERLHVDRGVHIAVEVPVDHAVRGQRADLDEMLGNLLDNACKWARTRVVLSSLNGAGGVTIAVEDDGPGLPAALRETVMQRGVRADEAAAGSGLGLAIVRELVDLYGGTVVLDDSPLGGLRVRVSLPAAP